MFEDKCDTIMLAEEDDVMSKLSEVWKYKHPDGTYHLRVKFEMSGGDLKSIIMKQLYRPYTFIYCKGYVWMDYNNGDCV